MYIGLDVHKKLSYYSMVDGEGTEMKGDRGAFGTSGLCQAICEEACEDRQGGCQSVSAIIEDELLAGELCSR